MAILAEIRNRPIFLILIIGMALFAFVLAGVFDGSGEPNRSNIGSINGEDISSDVFSKQLEAQKNRGTSSLQSVNNVWNSIVKKEIYNTQIEEVGIMVGEKDIWESIINNPANQNSPRFKDESGIFDENKFKEYVATLKDNKDTPQGRIDWQNWINYEKNIETALKQTAYTNLINSGLTASLKEGERTYISENTSADIQFIYVPYSSTKNEGIVISDNEITNYMNQHAKEFKAEASNEIDYVKFEVLPSKGDIAETKAKINSYKVDFINTKKTKEFVTDYSDVPFVDKLYMKTNLTGVVYDSLIEKPNGSVYGPYKDGDYFKLAKLINKDGLKSAKSSHILIAYKGAERAKPTIIRTKEEAQTFAKKIRKEINAKNFADKAKEYSDGPSGETKGGDIGWFDEKSALAKEYKEFILNKKKGAIEIVETSFGFHIIKIEDKKTEEGLNLGIVSLKVEPSELTESQIFQSTETFASDLTNGKKIIDLAKENNYVVKTASKLLLFSEQVTGLGNEREIVKWTYEKGTKIGDVKRFDLDNGDYAVVILKHKYPAGLMQMKDAKPKITPILKKGKQAKLIRAKMTGTTLEEIAKSTSKSISTSNNISITNPTLKVGGRDLDIIGSILYMKKNDLKIIDGTNGVYVFKVIKKTAPYALKKFDTYSNKISKSLKNRSSKVYDALKEISDIEDNRALFY